jgi:tRNA-dihydrouridine synthase A
MTDRRATSRACCRTLTSATRGAFEAVHRTDPGNKIKGRDPCPALDRRLSVAPMLDWTDRHCRFFLRLISRHTLLYTEMVTTGALLHGDPERFLRFDPAEHPVALQIGGSDPGEMSECARLGADWGYDEININVGCPSDRVQNGRFGACLMAKPNLVADCVAAMKDAVAVPVTVKSRIGIDERDSYGELVDFVGALTGAGCDALIVHARKAWLAGLSPKENRDIPPLRYDIVDRLKRDFPSQQIAINGGIKTLDETARFLRALLVEADRTIFGDDRPSPTRHEVLEAFLPYVTRELAAGVPLSAMSRHILGLFQGQPGARAWRRHLSEQAHRPGAGIDVLTAALPPQCPAGDRP